MQLLGPGNQPQMYTAVSEIHTLGKDLSLASKRPSLRGGIVVTSIGSFSEIRGLDKRIQDVWARELT